MQKKMTNVKLPGATTSFFHVSSQDKREVTPTLVPLTTHLTSMAWPYRVSQYSTWASTKHNLRRCPIPASQALIVHIHNPEKMTDGEPPSKINFWEAALALIANIIYISWLITYQSGTAWTLYFLVQSPQQRRGRHGTATAMSTAMSQRGKPRHNAVKVTSQNSHTKWLWQKQSGSRIHALKQGRQTQSVKTRWCL